MFNKKERETLIELICNEQTHMIIKHPESYDTPKYQILEELKVKVKDDEDAVLKELKVKISKDDEEVREAINNIRKEVNVFCFDLYSKFKALQSGLKIIDKLFEETIKCENGEECSVRKFNNISEFATHMKAMNKYQIDYIESVINGEV